MSDWDWNMSRIAWIDVETDGLVRPGVPFPLLLEVALVLTDADLNQECSYTAVMRHSEAKLNALKPLPVVVEMHERNGLWDALRGADTVPLLDAEQAMIGLLGEDSECPIVWGGCSPAALDRQVISRYMPAFYTRIHHRSVDVSALQLAMKNWAGLDISRPSASQHRALPDTLESIELAVAYRQFLTHACLSAVGNKPGASHVHA